MCNCWKEVIDTFIGLPLFLIVNGCAVAFVAAFCFWIFDKMVIREDEKK